MEQVNPPLRKLVLQVVNNQIGNQDPPETKQTFDRLVAEGISKKEARRLIGCVLIVEMTEMLKHRRVFDPRRYAQALARLPELPWDEEEDDE